MNETNSNFAPENQGSTNQSVNDTIFQNIQGSVPPMPDNSMVLAIIGTVLGLCNCFGIIPGIVAIVFASQVKSKYAQGDYVGAQDSADKAKTWGTITIILSIALIVLSVILNVTGVIDTTKMLSGGGY